ncbi:MAG TPA: DUF58 domain-containing protein [Spirochaetia bacterium]|nr:DUF58 domain-containing protein [Spirochaetia bacterium]
MDNARLVAKVKRMRLVSTKLVENLLAGNYRSVFRGPGIEFDEAREYVDGDDARLIDWNVSSRMGTAYTKVFREERELTLFLIVDMSGSLFFGAGDSSRRETESLLVSLLAFAAVANNDRVGACFFTDRIENWLLPKKGKKHALSIIQDMIGFEPTGKGSNLALAIKTAGEALKRRGICVILSDFKTTGYFRDLSTLAHRHDVIAVRIVDPLDTEYPNSGLVQLEDPESSRVILGAGSSRTYRKQYQEFWQLHTRQWMRECNRRGVATLEVRTDEDPAQRLIHFFRNRAKR